MDPRPTLIDENGRGFKPVAVVFVNDAGETYQIDLGGSIGDQADPAWNGTGPEASLISIMKGCYAQLASIAQNTGA